MPLFPFTHPAHNENVFRLRAIVSPGNRLLFSIINVARLYKIHPDDALERTNKKFIRRFNYVEEAAINQGRQLKDMTLEEMDALWNEAKAKGL